MNTSLDILCDQIIFATLILSKGMNLGELLSILCQIMFNGYILRNTGNYQFFKISWATHNSVQLFS